MALICSGCTTKQQVGKAKKEPPQSIHTEKPKKGWHRDLDEKNKTACRYFLYRRLQIDVLE